MRRRYTKAEKIAAVAESEVTGIPATAEAHGIPENTLRYWLDRPEFVELREKTRDEMRDGFKVLVHRAQERLTALVGEMEPRDLTILLGVATDKTLLMSGDATSRNETRALSDDLDDHERAALKAAIAGELAEREAAGGAAGTGVDPAASSDRPADAVGSVGAGGGSGIGQD